MVRHTLRAADKLCSPALVDASLASTLLPSLGGEGAADGGSAVTGDGVGTVSEL